ncbi:serine hydrolase [Streptomyces sp. JHA26]|uniref:serine hydrolase domain-containing protein n=1 Tax=Streptomyces sp. JHA26 TaxID=1917143 RepID=UPI00098A4971|nr:serine hydrolase domain-containing protein [Streptomyces sp. JHA26]
MNDTSALRTTLRRYVDDGTVPGAVALVARGDDVEVAAVGHVDADGTAPMARDILFRIASLTKPVVAAAVLALVEDGLLRLDDPVDAWLPELADPVVVRTPSAAVDDVVPAARPITVEDLLVFRAGWGFPSDFSLPAAQALSALPGHPLRPAEVPEPGTWLAALAKVPLLHQPGEAWLYNTCSDLQGVLIARVTGRPLPEFLAERLFEPLGMVDTAFEVPAAKRDRFTTFYRPAPSGDGTLEVSDTPDGQWGSLPVFPSGAGGLVSTADDLLAFARMLLAGGTANGRTVLSPASVRAMTTDHLTAAQREAARLFLEGQGWGYGGQVDVDRTEPWNVPGRYGWVGGSGTSAHLVPATGTTAVLLTQVAMTGPASTPLMRAFWRHAAGA